MIVAAVIYLMYVGISETSVYYMTVSELVDKKDAIYSEGVRVNGVVVPGSIKKDRSNLKVNFKIMDSEEKDSEKNILVYYEGIIPDMFQENIDVVVEGVVDNSGTLSANTLLTACPSKYEADKAEYDADKKEHKAGKLEPEVDKAENTKI